MQINLRFGLGKKAEARLNCGLNKSLETSRSDGTNWAEEQRLSLFDLAAGSIKVSMQHERLSIGVKVSWVLATSIFLHFWHPH